MLQIIFKLLYQCCNIHLYLWFCLWYKTCIFPPTHPTHLFSEDGDRNRWKIAAKANYSSGLISTPPPLPFSQIPPRALIIDSAPPRISSKVRTYYLLHVWICLPYDFSFQRTFFSLFFSFFSFEVCLLCKTPLSFFLFFYVCVSCRHTTRGKSGLFSVIDNKIGERNWFRFNSDLGGEKRLSVLFLVFSEEIVCLWSSRIVPFFPLFLLFKAITLLFIYVS